MTRDYTTNLNLVKPKADDQYNVKDFNDNMQAIDDFAGLTPPKALTADKLTTSKNINGIAFDGTKNIITGLGLYSETETYDSTNIVYGYIENNLKIFKSLVDNNIGNDLTDTAYWEEIKLGGGSGLEVCDIGMALYVDETKGLRRYLNGQIVDINSNTQAFLDRLKQITTLHPSLLCTEDEWQTAKTMSAFGQVGKFVFNYSGDEVVSVRIPRVVNVQGLFDLQNLGLTVEAGLPNITGKFGIGDSSNTSASGAFYTVAASRWNEGSGTKASNPDVGFNASRSSSIYGNSTTVQQEAIQYPYFIQIATGSETENNIINDIELNNPYSLFDSKYSDHELNNLSWLKSEGQWNAKAVYPTAYDKLLKVYNGTETVEGLSVKLSTEDYTDYDFVLNTSDETFRLPFKNHTADDGNSVLTLYYYVGETVQNANLIDAGRIGELVATKTDMLQASGAGMPSNRYIDLALGANSTSYTVPANGYIIIWGNSNTEQSINHVLYATVNKNKAYGNSVLGSNMYLCLYFPVRKGDTFQLNYTRYVNTAFRFYYAEGEVS